MDKKTLEAQLSGDIFNTTEDLTIGIEEEFQLLDPNTLKLTNRFEDLMAAAPSDLKESMKGELISSEIEMATKKCYSLKEARKDLMIKRSRLTDLALSLDIKLSATGAHPFSPWQEQQIIDTPHYRLVEESLNYVAWRNNTFSFHVHLGVRDKERAIKLTDLFRNYLPALLALSASSPFYEKRNTGLHSIRTQLFTKNFPRCGIPDIYGEWRHFSKYLKLLYSTNCISEYTQVWWSVRPHLNFGTVEIRICDGQPDVEDTLALSGLIQALGARLLKAIDHHEDMPLLPRALLEENCWRAIRYGISHKLVDFNKGIELDASEYLKQLLYWVEPQAASLDVLDELGRIETILENGNTASKQIAAYENGRSLYDIQRDMSAITMCCKNLMALD